jgi:hypothetical protein
MLNEIHEFRNESLYWLQYMLYDRHSIPGKMKDFIQGVFFYLTDKLQPDDIVSFYENFLRLLSLRSFV